MVWSRISRGECTNLHINPNGTFQKQIYAGELLRPNVMIYAVAIGDSFAFQHDNNRPHIARLVENMFGTENIQRVDWPACSSHLNLIEYVWDILDQDLLLLSETWSFHFLRSGIVFAKVLSIHGYHSWLIHGNHRIHGK